MWIKLNRVIIAQILIWIVWFYPLFMLHANKIYRKCLISCAKNVVKIAQTFMVKWFHNLNKISNVFLWPLVYTRKKYWQELIFLKGKESTKIKKIAGNYNAFWNFGIYQNLMFKENVIFSKFFIYFKLNGQLSKRQIRICCHVYCLDHKNPTRFTINYL